MRVCLPLARRALSTPRGRGIVGRRRRGVASPRARVAVPGMGRTLAPASRAGRLQGEHTTAPGRGPSAFRRGEGEADPHPSPLPQTGEGTGRDGRGPDAGWQDGRTASASPPAPSGPLSRLRERVRVRVCLRARGARCQLRAGVASWGGGDGGLLAPAHEWPSLEWVARAPPLRERGVSKTSLRRPPVGGRRLVHADSHTSPARRGGSAGALRWIPASAGMTGGGRAASS